ncbi:MAG: AraC family transcriptional regulator [Rhodoferax sp.]|uniref:AraC family transcriptional regulator n=1 Tax=Rhodoferax sp. TaxID=50421 RepID=UPI00271EFD17|nr:AraC family transcriptional regulator [Rhodoferax sp.]MDO8447908.1 AraC family transcriptional regulator [Rhodoferax sp.]
MTDLVRSAVLSNYTEVARSVGLDPYAMVKSVGLSQGCLVERDMKIPTSAVRRLLEDSAALSGAENFGLRMAETRRLSILGQLGMVAREAPTLRHVLDIIVQHMRLHNESLLLHMEDSGGLVTIRQDLLVRERGAMRQSVELSLGALMRILRIFLGSDWSPRRVCFVHQSPVDLGLHRRMFGAALEFGCEFDGIICKSSDLDTPIASSDPVMASYARRQIEASISPDSKATEHEVQQLVLILLPTGRCNIAQVARHLNLDRRTLHRHLGKEGTTFTQLVNSTRMDLSERYLAHPNRKLADIAELLGFSGLSAFSRWYSMQFKTTPSKRQVALQL